MSPPAATPIPAIKAAVRHGDHLGKGNRHGDLIRRKFHAIGVVSNRTSIDDRIRSEVPMRFETSRTTISITNPDVRVPGGVKRRKGLGKNDQYRWHYRDKKVVAGVTWFQCDHFVNRERSAFRY